MITAITLLFYGAFIVTMAVSDNEKLFKRAIPVFLLSGILFATAVIWS